MENSLSRSFLVKSLGRVFDVTFTFVIIWIIPYLSALTANRFGTITGSIDPPGAFAWISVHHVFQLALTLLLMKLFYHIPLSMWGFNLQQGRLSLKIFAWFCLIYLLPVFLVNVLPGLISGNPPSFNYPLTPKNVIGTLGFQFLLSGLGEEPLFRGFVMVFLSRSWKECIHIGKIDFPVAGLWATVFFAVAHFQINLHPFSVSISGAQLIWALGLGSYYAAAFHKTKSLLAPILSHGYSNGVIFVVLYSWALLVR